MAFYRMTYLCLLASFVATCSDSKDFRNLDNAADQANMPPIDSDKAPLRMSPAELAYSNAEDDLHWSYRGLRLAYGPSGRAAVLTEQRSWIAARNKACGFETKNACTTDWTAQRAKILQGKLNKIENDPQRVRVGQCFSTKVKDRGGRFGRAEGDEDYMSDDGTGIEYADGHTMVDYDANAVVAKWRVGDAVKLCVTDLPKNCPKGDYRGIGYKATNLRRKTSWVAGDSQHECGGA
jgi:uncharacterized protein YecT (DUF1311 family)